MKKGILIGIASLLCCVPSTEQRTATQAGRSAGTAQFRFRAVSSRQPTVEVGEREKQQQTAERRGSSRVDRRPDGRDACLPDRENTDEKCLSTRKTAKKKNKRERERVSAVALRFLAHAHADANGRVGVY